MKQWIKFYTEALHDRKMRKLNRFDKSVFYDLLLLAGQEDDDGRLPCIDDIALELDLKPTEASKSIDKLVSIGVIKITDDNTLVITQFIKRQESNLSGYERVKRYRDNKKTVINDNNQNVINDNAIDNTNDNAMITHDNNKNVINENANDTKMITVEEDIEEEIDIEEDINIYAPQKKQKPVKHKYGSWKNVLLTDDEYGKLKEKFFDADERIENLSIGIASKGYKYKDHYATILNWARMESKQTNKIPAQPQKSRLDEFMQTAAELNGIDFPRQEYDIDL